MADPQVRAEAGLTPAQAAVIALSGLTVLGVALICTFCPAARNFVLNIISSGYNRVIQALGMLDALSGGRLSQIQGQLSVCWSGFTQFMTDAWARLVCWANGNPGEAIIAEAREMAPLNQRARNNNRASEACHEAHAANRESGREIVRPAPPVPEDSQRRRQDLDRGALADDEASDVFTAPELDDQPPLETVLEEHCDGLAVLSKLAEKLEAVGRQQSPDPEDPRPEGQTEVALPEGACKNLSAVAEVNYCTFTFLCVFELSVGKKICKDDYFILLLSLFLPEVTKITPFSA